MGGKTQTTQQQSQNTPFGLPFMGDIWSKVSQVASQPYTPYTGEMVAGLNPTQQAGVQGVTNAQGAAQPYFNQAADYARSGASAIDPSQIDRYMSPYTQNVIDATRANFNENNAQQQSQITGNAALKGALGGDRVGVARAEAARQQKLAQDPVIAGMYSSAYDKALGAAQQDRSAQAQGAYTFGALAPSVQNAQIGGAQAQIGAGGLQQQNEQQKLSAAYNQYLQQLAFPYQQAGFLASAGLPAVAGMGGTSSGTTTQPGPNPWGQIAGLGLMAATLRDGGRVPEGNGYAKGGPIGFFDVDTYIPKFSGVQAMSPYGSAPALPAIGKPAADMSLPSASQMSKGMGGLMDKFGGMFMPEGGNYASGMDMAIPSSVTGMVGGGLKRGGRVSDRHALFHETVNAIRQTLRGGGRVFSDERRMHGTGGYADGGNVFGDRFNAAMDLTPNDYVDRGFTDTKDAIDAGAMDPQGANAPGPQAFMTPQASPAVPMPMPRPANAPGAPSPYALPPIMTAGAEPDLPDDAMAFNGPKPSPYAMPPQAAPMPPPAAEPTSESKSRFGGWNPMNLSDEARSGLMAAGLGMMASKSPFALTQIGEGGLQGVKQFTNEREQKRKIESEAKRLAQSASQFAQNLGLHRDQLAETKRYHSGVLDRENNKLIGTNDEGFPVYVNTRTGEETVGKTKLTGKEQNKFIGTNDEGFPVYVDAKTGKETVGTTKLQGKAPAGYVKNADGTMTAIKGGPADPEQLAAVAKAKTTGALLPDDTADFLADRVLAGDAKALTNLGRGAQGAENIIKVQTLVARKAAQRGMDPSDILAKVAEQSGLSASQRTFGTQTAKMAVNATEAEGAIELGRTASAAVPRTNWVPVNKAIQAFQSGTSDPALAKFGAANLAIINTYARAINPNGVGTVHDKEHAEKMLSTAMGRDAYLAVLDQMNAEIDIAHKAAPKAKQELERLRKSGTQSGGELPASAAGAPPTNPKKGDRFQFKQDGRPVWGVWDGTKWGPEKP